MENLEDILTAYAHSAEIEESIKRITAEGATRLLWNNGRGSMPPIQLAALFNEGVKHQLIISPDKEQSAYLFNDLRNILGEDKVHFMPDSFKRPGSYDRFEPSNVLARTEIVSRYSNENRHFIICSYPEALMERVISTELLADHRIQVVQGEDVDMDSLMEVLIEFNFERTDFVYEPGQFSIRGGIIDLFSFGSEWPYRVELFDDEVESIRLFNPTDQRSLRSIKSFSIIPNVNKNFQSAQKVGLHHVLPKNTLIVFAHYDYAVERWNTAYERMIYQSNNLSIDTDENIKSIVNSEAIEDVAAFISNLEFNPLLFLRKPSIQLDFDKEFNFDSKPQPDFNKHFDLLIENLNENTKQGINNFLFVDNPKQIERFYNIFEDLKANVQFSTINKSLSKGFIDNKLKIAAYTDHQIFKRFHRYKLKRGFSKSEAINVKMLRELQKGDFVTHIDHGVGRFSGLETLTVNGHTQESVRLIYLNNDILYVGINSLHKISKFVGKDGTAPKLNKLGSDAWERVKRKTKKHVKDIAKELIKLYARRKSTPGFAFPQDGYLQNELEASFIYEDTPDQVTATLDVKNDMTSPHPMDRLICGDVGFGKTEIAIRAAYKAVLGGKQVAVLVPTTILALQHAETFKTRLKDFGCEVDYINRFRSAKEKRIINERLEAGKIDILIGTHAILNAKIKFKDIGLLVIDEEQKFGVSAKEKLRQIKINVDTLILTATPIPRTLQFSLMAARDMSILRTAPPNRQPIYTEVRVFNDELIRDSIRFEVDRGGQVFFVHNRVKSLEDIYVYLKRLCPDVLIRKAHGQMEPKMLEKTLVDFINGEFDLLLSTNIIETGLDIPNANTIIINQAQNFGLSDLHQLRGRVGRSNRKAYCYLFSPPMSTLTAEARKRLMTIEEFSDLGSGFHIAMKDMDIRGAGNLLGGEQSGFISDIGYETYQKILSEAIIELKRSDFKELFKEELEKNQTYVHDVLVDLDMDMLIPSEYVSNTQERLNLYTSLDALENEDEIDGFKKMLNDRFGNVPKEVDMLFIGLRMRWIGKKLGFGRIIYKDYRLRLYFVENPQSDYYESPMFMKIMAYVSAHGKKLELEIKQSYNRLFVLRQEIDTVEEIYELLQKIESGVITE